MKSFSGLEVQKRQQKDTKIPNGELPFILLHWLHEHYYGGGLSPLDMRKFLEAKMRDTYYERDVVIAWISRAHHWEQQMEACEPGSVRLLLEQYYQLRVAA